MLKLIPDNKQIALAFDTDYSKAKDAVKWWMYKAGYVVVKDDDGLFHLAYRDTATGFYDEHEDIVIGGEFEQPDPDAEPCQKGWVYITPCSTEKELIRQAFDFLMLKKYPVDTN